MLYFEKEFILKEELTLMLFERKETHISKYVFKEKKRPAKEAVDAFLSSMFHTPLAGCPSSKGLSDLQRELDLLQTINRNSPRTSKLFLARKIAAI